jgi:exosortase D (VPLPA-CTERM-specific)
MPSTGRPESALVPSVASWQFLVLGALTLWLYWSTLGRLVHQWVHDPDFSHGFFVPLFSGFVIWQSYGRLARIPRRPSWIGLIPLVAGLGVLIVGRLGAEIFLERSSLLLVLAGIVILFLGLDLFRAVVFPWAFLLLMIPIPAIVLNEIKFPLQLLASQVAATVLPWLGVPVLREGNIINLAAMPLEVADACSGIRSLMSLVTLGIIYGYLMDKRLWVRWLLACAAVPITVFANDIRIVGTGLLVEYWNPEAAEGYYHTSWGVLIFVISLLTLYALHAGIRRVWPDREVQQLKLFPKEAKSGAPMKPFTFRFLAAAILIAAVAVLLQARGRGEVFPPRLSFNQFPDAWDGWSSTDLSIDQATLDVLGPGDYLHREYRNQSEQPDVELWMAYISSQAAGDALHSPKNCLPGAGWSPIASERVTLAFPGHKPFPANRYVLALADKRQVLLYWYWAHDRGVASEYWAKYYLVADSIRMHRSDGALVRINTALFPGETAEAAEQRLLPFAEHLMPLLDQYIPR